MNNSLDHTALLHLLHLVSPALPVGAYAYSQGFEYAVERGWVSDDISAEQWIAGVLRYNLGRLDLPVLARCVVADDQTVLLNWNRFLIAARETAEFELEDTQMGQALLRLLQSLEIPGALQWPGGEKTSFATQFAIVGRHWQIEPTSLLHGFAWSWLENQVAAATKLVPLGQTRAQQMLVSLLPVVKDVVASANHVKENDLGAGLPGLIMASMQHETQYSRLFRS